MRMLPLLAAAGLLMACGDTPTATDPATESFRASPPTAAASAAQASTASEVAQLRRLLAPYHTLAKASAAGWDTDITGCLELPGVGGMGHHYANLGWLTDGEIRWDHPELLVLAPSPNNRDELKLVAAEYIVFKSEMPTAPSLYGQTFHSNDAAAAWVLHVWIGDHNPDGLFADWNPTISCN